MEKNPDYLETPGKLAGVNMIGKLTIFAAAVAALPSLAHAQTAGQEPATVTIAVSAGTLGVGPEIGYRHNPLIGIRADAEFLGFSHDVNVDQIKYHGDARLRGYGATADLYPFKNGFRVSAGVRINEDKIKIVATPQQSVTVGHTIYTPDQIGTINGNIRANKVVPVFTLGYAHNLHKGLTWSADGGVMLWGKPEVYDISATGQLANNPVFQSNLIQEEGKIENKVAGYRVYPVAKLSLGWAF